MKKILFLLVLIFGISNSLPAQDFDIGHLYPIETSHSYVHFNVTYMGYAKVRGSFGQFYGSVYYNPEQPASTSVSFQVDVASIDTNNDWRDKDLKSGNWFLEEEYPHIRFVSSKAVKKKNQLLITGKLTIKETTKEISFLITPSPQIINDIRGDRQAIFTGSYTLNRKEYGVMGANWNSIKEGIAALSDEVTIEFSLLGKQIQSENFSNFLRNPKTPQGAIYNAYKDSGTAGAIDEFNKLKSDESLKINSNALNIVSYMCMKLNKLEDAQILLTKNMETFPDDPNVYDSMGELKSKTGDLQEAMKLYKKSLDMDPKNMNALEALKHLKKYAD